MNYKQMWSELKRRLQELKEYDRVKAVESTTSNQFRQGLNWGYHDSAYRSIEIMEELEKTPTKEFEQEIRERFDEAVLEAEKYRNTPIAPFYEGRADAFWYVLSSIEVREDKNERNA